MREVLLSVLQFMSAVLLASTRDVLLYSLLPSPPPTLLLPSISNQRCSVYEACPDERSGICEERVGGGVKGAGVVEMLKGGGVVGKCAVCGRVKGGGGLSGGNDGGRWGPSWWEGVRGKVCGMCGADAVVLATHYQSL